MKRLHAIAAMVFMVLLGSSCGLPVGLSASRDGRELEISWTSGSASSRLLMPSGIASPASFDVLLTAADGGSFSRNGITSSTWRFSSLPASSYFVSLTARDANGKAIAVGSASVNLLAEQRVSVTLPLSYVSTGEGTGGIRLSIVHPFVSPTSCRLTVIDPAGSSSSPELSASFGAYTYSAAATPVGVYRLFITLQNGAKTASWMETLLVLQNIETVGTVSFAASDFVERGAPTRYVLDQSQVLSDRGAGGTTQWQEVSPEVSGSLERVDWYLTGSPLAPYEASCRINVYEGEGSAGSKIGSSAIMAIPGDSGGGWFRFDFSGISLNAGQSYTLELTTPSVTVGWVALQSGNPYPAGTTDFMLSTGEDMDYCFKTYVETSGGSAGDPAADIAAAADALQVGFTAGDSAGSVRGNLSLPSVGIRGTQVLWSSRVPSVISDSGIVCRPEAGSPDQEVTIDATVAKEALSTHREFRSFTLLVKAREAEDSSAADVAAAKAALEIAFATGDSASSVTANLSMASAGGNGVAIIWTSSDEARVGVDGVVSRPSAGSLDATVVLTATLSKGSVSDTRIFELVVKALPQEESRLKLYAAAPGAGADCLECPVGAVALAVLDSGIVVQLSDGSFRRWTGVWTEAYLPAPTAFISMCFDGASLWGAADDGGLYRFDGQWRSVQTAPSPLRSLSRWGNSVAGLGADGQLYLLDSLWRRAGTALPVGTTSIAEVGSTRYALTAEGDLYRLDGLWTLDGRTSPAGSFAVAASKMTLYFLTR